MSETQQESESTRHVVAIWEAVNALKRLGWRDAVYCPKDGSPFDAIEAGSTGIHRCHYFGEWPNGHYFVEEAGDLWPSRPILFRPCPVRESLQETVK